MSGGRLAMFVMKVSDTLNARRKGDLTFEDAIHQIEAWKNKLEYDEDTL